MKHDGTANKYAETNGRHNVCAIRSDGVLSYELWDVSERPHRRLGAYETAAEAKEAAK